MKSLDTAAKFSVFSCVFVFSGCSMTDTTGMTQNLPFPVSIGETVTRTSIPAEGNNKFYATMEVDAGETYGVGAAVGGTQGLIPSSSTVELRIEGPIEGSPIIVRSFSQTPGLSLSPDLYFTTVSNGTVRFVFTNATQDTGTPFDLLLSRSIDFEMLVTRGGPEGRSFNDFLDF